MKFPFLYQTLLQCDMEQCRDSQLTSSITFHYGLTVPDMTNKAVKLSTAETSDKKIWQGFSIAKSTNNPSPNMLINSPNSSFAICNQSPRMSQSEKEGKFCNFSFKIIKITVKLYFLSVRPFKSRFFILGLAWWACPFCLSAVLTMSLVAPGMS